MLLIYEDVTKESPVRFAIVLKLLDVKDPNEKHNQQIQELCQKRADLARERAIATGEDVEDAFGFVDGLTLEECNRSIAMYMEQHRRRARVEELAAAEKKELKVHSDYWAAAAVHAKQDELWRNALGPKPDWCSEVRELERQKSLERDRREDDMRKQEEAQEKAREKERLIEQERKRRKEEDVLGRENKRKIDEQTAHEHYS